MRAYMQLPVRKDCRHILSIATHIGYLRCTEVAEGIASGSDEFEKMIEACLQGFPGTIPYLGNIYVTSSTDKEHFKNLKLVCHRLEECGLKLNNGKSEFFKLRDEVLGFVIDAQGFHKARSKVKAMIKAPRPTDENQLQAFLELVNFYARFLPNCSVNLKGLYDFASTEEFVLTSECKKSVCCVKVEFASQGVLTNYNPVDQAVLACDASAYGLTTILSHR